MITAKILAFAGSARQDSVNKKLVKIAVEGAKAAGAEVTYLDFRDLPLPLYDGEGITFPTHSNSYLMCGWIWKLDWLSASKLQCFESNEC